MDSHTNILYSAAGHPALISTGITFIYIFLKLCRYLAHAISHKSEGRGGNGPHQVVVNRSTAQIRESKATRKFTNKYQGILQNSMAEGPKDPQGPFLYQEGGKTYASLPVEMLQSITTSPLFDKMQKDCKAEGIEIPKNIMAKDPVTHMLTPQEYLQKVEAGTMPPMDNHLMMKQMAESADNEQSDQVYDDGVPEYRASGTVQNSTTPKNQVSHVALQTDSCDTLYITKNALTAYTIAIVQNAQALQYDQMHLALQMARNQASLETPLRAYELLTAHFNLAVISNETDITKTSDAQKPEASNLDAEPSASAADEETYVKIPSCRYTANSDTKKQHPTGAVAPTCRREYGLVNGIPAGYETDDSWDNDSHTHEHTHMHNIVPLLSICPWNNRPHRGREQPHGQHNNINVRTGHAPYSRPWDNQPYGRCTRSQQALHARAYRKIQCRYPIQ